MFWGQWWLMAMMHRWRQRQGSRERGGGRRLRILKATWSYSVLPLVGLLPVLLVLLALLVVVVVVVVVGGVVVVVVVGVAVVVVVAAAAAAGVVVVVSKDGDGRMEDKIRGKQCGEGSWFKSCIDVQMFVWYVQNHSWLRKTWNLQI